MSNIRSISVTKIAAEAISKGCGVKLASDKAEVEMVDTSRDETSNTVFGVALNSAAEGELVGVVVAGECDIAVSSTSGSALPIGTRGCFDASGKAIVVSGSAVHQFQTLSAPVSGSDGSYEYFMKGLLFDKR